MHQQWNTNPSTGIYKWLIQTWRRRENNEIEPITGIKVYNEETDHAVAVSALPIIIHNLES